MILSYSIQMQGPLRMFHKHREGGEGLRPQGLCMLATPGRLEIF